MLGAFRLLAKFRRLRGTPFDVFGRSAERRSERQLITEYEATLDEIAARLTPQNHAAAMELAAIPMEVRGYGHIKEESQRKARARSALAMSRFRSPPPHALAAE
jgi:indolepyruvate ferredoxin oxidoreductase